MAASVAFAIYFLVPNAWTVEPFAPEAYLVLSIWSILGCLYFLRVFHADTHHRFGRSMLVWVVLLALIFYAAHMWVRQANHRAAMLLIRDVEARQAAAGAVVAPDGPAFAEIVHDDLEDSINLYNSFQLGLAVLSLTVLGAIFATMELSNKELWILGHSRPDEIVPFGVEVMTEDVQLRERITDVLAQSVFLPAGFGSDGQARLCPCAPD